MRLTSYTLSEEHLQKFDQLMMSIDGHEVLRDELRANFKKYLREQDPPITYSGTELTRLLQQPSGRKYQRMIGLFDFVMNGYVEKAVKDRHNRYTGEYDDVLQVYDDLRHLISPIFGLSSNPFEAIRAQSEEANLPSTNKYSKKYIGYRRSSRKGEVIRFFIEIYEPDSQGEVKFINEYWRLHSHWLVHGTTSVWSNILYLFGFADKHASGEGLGFRFMALKELENSNVLAGPIVSKDNEGPMSARVVLVPLEEHKWTAEQAAMDERELINYLISPDSARDAEAYIREIKTNIGKVFDGYGDDHIFRLISNFTLTVVRACPSELDSLIQQELRFRKAFHQGGGDLRGVGYAITQALARVDDEDILTAGGRGALVEPN